MLVRSITWCLDPMKCQLNLKKYILLSWHSKDLNSLGSTQYKRHLVNNHVNSLIAVCGYCAHLRIALVDCCSSVKWKGSNCLRIVRWMRHCPRDTGFEIRAEAEHATSQSLRKRRMPCRWSKIRPYQPWFIVPYVLKRSIVCDCHWWFIESTANMGLYL